MGDCWATNSWATNSWANGSWCPSTPPSPSPTYILGGGTVSYYDLDFFPKVRRKREEEEIVVIM